MLSHKRKRKYDNRKRKRNRNRPLAREEREMGRPSVVVAAAAVVEEVVVVGGGWGWETAHRMGWAEGDPVVESIPLYWEVVHAPWA